MAPGKVMLVLVVPMEERFLKKNCRSDGGFQGGHRSLTQFDDLIGLDRLVQPLDRDGVQGFGFYQAADPFVSLLRNDDLSRGSERTKMRHGLEGLADNAVVMIFF